MTVEKKSLEFIFARAFSYMFHPLLIPVVGVYIINYYFGDRTNITEEGKIYLLIITGISTLILPLAFVPMMLYQKLIESIEMKTAKERLTPLFIFAVFYFFAWFVMTRLNAPVVYKTFLLAAGFSVLCGLGINFFTKISMHMIGIGGLTGSVYSLMIYSNSNLQLLLIILIIIAGIIGFSRLKQNAHNPLQVYLGYGLGISVSVLLFYIFRGSLYL